MLGLIAPTLCAVIAALLLGGSLRRLVNAHVAGLPLVLAVFAVELVLYNRPTNEQAWVMAVGPWVWLTTRFILLGVVIQNALPVRGTVCWPLLLAACGLALNALAIALNGGHMPQSQEAAAVVWGAGHIDPHRLQNVVPMHSSTALPWLGDVIPEPVWLPRRNVVSLGDLFLALGLAWWAFHTAAPSGVVARRRIVAWIGAPIHGSARPTRGCPT